MSSPAYVHNAEMAGYIGCAFLSFHRYYQSILLSGYIIFIFSWAMFEYSSSSTCLFPLGVLLFLFVFRFTCWINSVILAWFIWWLLWLRKFSLVFKNLPQILFWNSCAKFSYFIFCLFTFSIVLSNEPKLNNLLLLKESILLFNIIKINSNILKIFSCDSFFDSWVI